MIVRIILVKIIILLFLEEGLAQYDLRNVHQIEGLPDNRITAIQQDQYGFIWIGTHDGLFKYDGYSITSFKPSNSTLLGRDIADIGIDPQNRVWVGTIDAGLFLYHYEIDTFYSFANQILSNGYLMARDIRSIEVDNIGRVWVASKHSLNLYDPDSNNFIVYDSIIYESLIKNITNDTKGNIWIGTYGKELIRFNPGTESFTQFEASTFTHILRIQTLASISEDKLLIGTRDHGLLIFDAITGSFKPFFDSKATYSNHESIRSIFVDGEYLWIGTEGNGVFSIKTIKDGWAENDELWTNIEPGDFGNTLNTIFKDRDGNLWIGSAWEGLSMLEKRPPNVQYYWNEVADKIAPVWSIYQEGQEIWLGTHGHGVFIHQKDKGLVEHFGSTLKNIPESTITTIKKGINDNFWLGTYSSGLILFDKVGGEERRFSTQMVKGSQLGNDVRDVIQISDSTFLVAIWGAGVYELNLVTNEFSQYQIDSNTGVELSHFNVVDLEQRDNDNIWVATFGGGLELLNLNYRTFSHEKSYTKNITCLHEDANGWLWIGTWENGLVRLNIKEDSLEWFDIYPFLAGETIGGILEDDKQNIWFSTTRSICKYDVDQDTILTYSQLNGNYHFGASHKGDDGYLYFGGANGVVAFQPSEMQVQNSNPHVRITGIELFNRPVRHGKNQVIKKPIYCVDEITLKYHQDVLTLNFAALSFPKSSKCEYSIMLENFDKEWRNIGSNRSATYTSLSPGSYEFKVRARIDNSRWPDSYSSIQVNVEKPYWAKWYAFIAYALLFGLLLYLFRRYTLYWEKMKTELRMEKLGREKEAELSEVKLRFFTDISHEIRTPVTLIVGFINRLLETGITNRVQQTAIEGIQKNGHHLLNLVSELLDFRKLESGEAQLKVAEGDLTKFTKEVFLSFKESAETKGILFTLDESPQNLMVWFDRDEMEKVLYNLISNALKFTPPGGKVNIGINHHDQFAYIKICDTGKGISEKQLKDIFKRFYQSDTRPHNNEKTGFGLGLAIVHDIIKLHGGEIAVDSELNKGTTFTIKLQLGKEHLRPEFILDSFQDSEEASRYIYADQDMSKLSQDVSFTEFAGMSVLIVEDNEGIREYLSNILKGHFHLILAKNGVEGLEAAYEHLPDLVLTDVMMPEMDGVTLTTRLKSDPRTSHIPVIILTARTSLIYKKEGLDVGTDDYITKPFNEVLLKSRIRNLLKTRMKLREKYKTELLLEPEELAWRSPDQEFLKRLNELIESQVGNPELSVEFLCKEMGMSQSVVYKKLKSLTGMSINEFIRDFRLKMAGQLMVRQKLNATQACAKVGIGDRSYFTHAFKAKYGMTPAEYMRNTSN